RSVAPRSIATPQIYWGAVPFLLLQLLVVAILIIAPGIVTKTPPPASVDDIRIELPPFEMPRLE
ncbi:hypothetical protein, partial [Mycobacterium tuberculosis]|uniref:hypothetical protein n=1 Tax=Mycobacterium tuberculosis TaxID=1773 RepID=UPI001BE0666D